MSLGGLPSIGYAISASRAGRMSVPVNPALYIYSHFRHVSGVPAPEGTHGVAIDKLKILDTLIEQLTKMKQKPSPYYGDEEGSSLRIDSLIQHYESQIKAAQAAAQVSPYTAASAAVTAPGSIVAVSA